MVKCNITHYIFFIGLFCTVIVYTGGEDPLTYTSSHQMSWAMPLFDECDGKVPLDGSVQGDLVAFIGKLVALIRSAEPRNAGKNDRLNKLFKEEQEKGVVVGGKVSYSETDHGCIGLLLTNVLVIGVPEKKANEDINGMRNLISNSDVNRIITNSNYIIDKRGVSSIYHTVFDYIHISANIPVSLSNKDYTTYITCSKRVKLP